MSFVFNFGPPKTEVEGEDAPAAATSGVDVEADTVDDSRLKLPTGVVLSAVEASSHEKEEKEVFSVRCRLFRMAPDVEGELGWRERCTGTLRVFKHDTTGIIRNVMRQDGTKKIFMNHIISPNAALDAHPSNEKALLYKATDFADGEATDETFLMRFKNPEVATGFSTEFAKFQESMRETLARRKADGTSTEGAASVPAPKTAAGAGSASVPAASPAAPPAPEGDKPEEAAAEATDAVVEAVAAGIAGVELGKDAPAAGTTE